MRTGLIAEKIGMSSMFTDSGKRYTITFLKVDNCQVVGHRTTEKDGYNALILGAKEIKASKLSKSLREDFAKKSLEPKAKIKEFRVSESDFVDIGTQLNANHFAVDQFVDVAGISIGKGFAGSMKRHNFRGLEASHGVSISHRSHGSTGGRQDPGRVFKNKKMAGHMGDKQVTIQNLRIVGINEDSNTIMVSGNVPGSKGSYVCIKDAVKKATAAI